MATVSQYFPAAAFEVGSANIPELVVVQGTNFPSVGYAFGINLSEAAYVRWVASLYGSGNLTVTCYSRAVSATSGTITWGAALSVITADTDNVSELTDSFATENTANSTAASSAGRVFSTEITVSNLDSLAADDTVMMRIRRTDNGATGDVVLLGVLVTYSDT